MISSGEKYAILNKPLFLMKLAISEGQCVIGLSQNEIILFPNQDRWCV